MSGWRGAAAVLVAYLASAWGANVLAHTASNGFVAARVEGSTISGSMELAVRDVELAVGIDANQDNQVTWGELRAGERKLAQYLAEHVTFSSGTMVCEPASFSPMQVAARTDGSYAWMPFVVHCPATVQTLVIGYSVLGDVDPSHRGLLTLAAAGTVQSAVLGGDNAVYRASLHASSPWTAFRQYFRAGVLHIWSGIDHLLFLISLLLPAVLWRRDASWEPVARARPALLSIVRVVTAFTLAHSLTLALAAFDVVRLPNRLTESIIAASIVIAALNNIFPLVTEHRARIAFAFGLLHGFGFASVLTDMGLPDGARVLSLLAFNGGIEAGQLAVVVTVMPVLYAMRTGVLYRRAVLPWGSAAIAVLAMVWLVQRAVFPVG